MSATVSQKEHTTLVKGSLQRKPTADLTFKQ